MNAGHPLNRLLWLLPTLLGAMALVFALLRLAPGDPIAMMVGPGASAKDIEVLRQLYGLDRSIPAQFLIYVRDVFTGQLGSSISLRQDVAGLVAARLPVTLELSLLALVLAVSGGVTLAMCGAYWKDSLAERVIDFLTGVLTSIPDFLWGLAGILLFGVFLQVLPSFGLLDSALSFESGSGFYLAESLLTGRFDVFGSALAHLLMPALSLALPLAAMIARVLKASLLDALTQDYILIARAKGFSPFAVLWREALRNAVVPALTLTSVQFTFLIAGTVLIEKLFGLPGLGNMAIDAVVNRDLPLIQGIVLTFALIFIAVNLLTDLANVWLNPKLRRG